MAKRVTRVKAKSYWNILVKKLKEGRFTHYLKEVFWNDGSDFARVIVSIAYWGGECIFDYLIWCWGMILLRKAQRTGWRGVN